MDNNSTKDSLSENNEKVYRCIVPEHLGSGVLDEEKYRVYKSSTVIEYADRLAKSCEHLNTNITDFLELEGLRTFRDLMKYNIWLKSMEVDPLFIRVFEDLMEVVKEVSPDKAKYAWIHSWLNYDTHDSVEKNLRPHAHNNSIHGYISISPQKTKTVFDDWELVNEIGNIYVGVGKWVHHVENLEEYEGPRATIGFDVIYGDLPPEVDLRREGEYQSLPWHGNWMPVILK